jgi:hypothetical protein
VGEGWALGVDVVMLHAGDTVIVFAATTEVKLHVGVKVREVTTLPLKLQRKAFRQNGSVEIRKWETFKTLHAKIGTLASPAVLLTPGHPEIVPKLAVPGDTRSRWELDSEAAGHHGADVEFARIKNEPFAERTGSAKGEELIWKVVNPTGKLFVTLTAYSGNCENCTAVVGQAANPPPAPPPTRKALPGVKTSGVNGAIEPTGAVTKPLDIAVTFFGAGATENVSTGFPKSPGTMAANQGPPPVSSATLVGHPEGFWAPAVTVALPSFEKTRGVPAVRVPTAAVKRDVMLARADAVVTRTGAEKVDTRKVSGTVELIAYRRVLEKPAAEVGHAPQGAAFAKDTPLGWVTTMGA